MKYDAEDVWKQTTHVRCMMCEALHDASADTLTSEDDIDLYYDLMECCDDPFLVGVIITGSPLFPPDDPGSSINQDHYIEMFDKYHYELNDDLFNELEGMDAE